MVRKRPCSLHTNITRDCDDFLKRKMMELGLNLNEVIEHLAEHYKEYDCVTDEQILVAVKKVLNDNKKRVLIEYKPKNI